MRAYRATDGSGHQVPDRADAARERFRSFARPPVEYQVRRVALPGGDRVFPPRAPEHLRCDEHARRRPSSPRRAHERHPLHIGQTFVCRRRFELTQRPHLGGGSKQSSLPPRSDSKLVGTRELVEAIEQPLYEVDLGLCERRIHPDAPGRDRPAPGGVDRVASGRTGEERVVEHDAADTRRELRVEYLGEPAQ